MKRSLSSLSPIHQFPLFDAFFIVELQQQQQNQTINNTRGNSSTTNAVIIAQYPTDSTTVDQSILNSIPNFCFPDGWPHSSSNNNNYCSSSGGFNSSSSSELGYTFTLQSGEGYRKYGTCHIVFNKQSQKSECYCILSHFPYFTMMNHILLICYARRTLLLNCSNNDDGDNDGHMRGTDITLLNKSVYPFLQKVLNHPFPFPGEKFSITCDTGTRLLDRVHYLKRPDDHHFNFSDVEMRILFSILNTKQVLQLFHSALCEQRIVIVGDDANTVSLCCHSLCALLYPFSWQHIYIPVLPAKLLSYVCAPMPFIVGIHTSMLREMRSLPTEHIVLVNLNSRTIELLNASAPNVQATMNKSRADQPFKLVFDEPLFNQLYESLESLRTEYETQDRSSTSMNASFTEAVLDKFLDFFISLFGRYRLYARPENNYRIDLKSLISDVVSSIPRTDPLRRDSVLELLERMEASQLLEMFLLESANIYRENGRNLVGGEFEMRCSRVVPFAYGLSQEEAAAATIVRNVPASHSSAMTSPLQKNVDSLLKDITKTSSNLNQFIKAQTQQIKTQTSTMIANSPQAQQISKSISESKTASSVKSSLLSFGSKLWGGKKSSGSHTSSGVRIGNPRVTEDDFPQRSRALSSGSDGWVLAGDDDSFGEQDDEEYENEDSLLYEDTSSTRYNSMTSNTNRFSTGEYDEERQNRLAAKRIEGLLTFGGDLPNRNSSSSSLTFEQHHRLLGPYPNSVSPRGATQKGVSITEDFLDFSSSPPNTKVTAATKQSILNLFDTVPEKPKPVQDPFDPFGDDPVIPDQHNVDNGMDFDDAFGNTDPFANDPFGDDNPNTSTFIPPSTYSTNTITTTTTNNKNTFDDDPWELE